MSSSAETPMVGADVVVDGAVDNKGRPASRFKTGGWRSAGFIIAMEIAERFAFYGISSNLISYLSGPLGQSTAAAAANVNAWSGTTSLLPLFGAFVADSFLGRYRTIAVASLLYISGLALLTLSAILLSLRGSPTQFQVVLFYFSLYVVSIAQSGHKPCTQAFGADQFDSNDAMESNAKSSFFNWWYFGVCAAASVTILIVSYIQDNLSWALGFGIPFISMVVGLVVFLLGTTTYRYSIPRNEKGPFLRIGRVFVAAFRNWRRNPSVVTDEEESRSFLSHHHKSEQFKFLNKALLAPDPSKEGDGFACGSAEVEEAKALLRLVPIWLSCLIFGIVYAQISTFFTKQGATMERTIVPGIKIPAASLQCFIAISILVSVPIYDWILVPTARAFTRKPSGITTLQRTGTGILISVITMIVAALVEIKRLKTALEFNLVDKPSSTIPMSIWWLVSQYILIGIAEVFTMVGLQEFFYDQVPADLRSVGLALYLSVLGVGSFLSSFLISVIEKATGGGRGDSWFSDNLNRARLDYFYWLLAGLSLVGFVAFCWCARSYIYNRTSTI